MTARVNRAKVYTREGRYGEALADLEEAIRLNPEFAPAYGSRAAVYLAMQDYDKAWANVKTCRRLGTEPPREFLQALINASGRTE